MNHLTNKFKNTRFSLSAFPFLLSFFSFLAYFFLLLPMFLYADHPSCTPGGGKICNPIKAHSIQELIQIILIDVIKIGFPIIVLAIVYCGFLFVFARGNEEKITKARDALMWTLIGAAVLLGAWSIAKLITKTVTSLG